jgi:hypothetical protein
LTISVVKPIEIACNLILLFEVEFAVKVDILRHGYLNSFDTCAVNFLNLK